MKPNALTWDEAQYQIQSLSQSRALRTCQLPTIAAANHILAENQYSKLDLPGFNKSAMDGYAICALNANRRYRVVEMVPAGRMPTQTLTPNTTIKIMTGAPVPSSTIKIIPHEHVTFTDPFIEIHHDDSKTHLCAQGEDVKTGDLLLPIGTALGPLEIANLIAAGITDIPVYEKINVAILTTGDEIVDRVSDLTPGKIMNSNGPLLKTLCEQQLLNIVMYQTISDDLPALKQALKEASSKTQIILLSGGVSAGDFDLVKAALDETGFQTHFSEVAMKPGKPLTFATNSTCLAFGLPGNPVAVYLFFHLAVGAAIDQLLKRPSKNKWISLPLAHAFTRKNAERLEFVPCILNADGLLEAIEYHGSAHLSALLHCDGFFKVNIGIEAVAKGEKAAFFLKK